MYMTKVYRKISILFAITLIVGLFIHFTPSGKLNFHEFSIHKKIINPPFLFVDHLWADSLIEQMSLEEKIGQLFMVEARPRQGISNYQKVTQLIKKYKVGGVIIFHGEPVQVAELINSYQEKAKIPLLIATDAEWGLSMRFSNCITYPRQMTLGAIQDERLIYNMGKDIGEQLKAMGIHINFAPVVDVNNNPDNPVIGNRSFGEDRANVARKGILYMNGMQDQGILAVAKHFPGHGDTDIDSHYNLPVINHTRSRLDSMELFPFRELIRSGVGGIMTAHLHVPALDDNDKVPSTLSALVVDSLLKKELKFKGLVFTDAMNMQAVSANYKPYEANLEAIFAGNDILLMPHEVPKTIQRIKRAIRKGQLTEEDINSRCKKILLAKYWAGLHQYKPSSVTKINEICYNANYSLLKRKLVEASLTVVKNKKNRLPLQRLDTLNIVSLAIGVSEPTDFQKMLQNYARVKLVQFPTEDIASQTSQIAALTEQGNVFIISVHNTNSRPQGNYGITKEVITFIDSLCKHTTVILNLFSSPYALSEFSVESYQSIIVSYEDCQEAEELSAQLIFGAIASNGTLPVSVDHTCNAGTGISTKQLKRLRYTIPLEAGMDENYLYKIDSIVEHAISEKATPGCQIVVARDGKVFYNRVFGYHDYRQRVPVDVHDLYDLASITKIAASIATLMKLDDEKKININDPISKYLPYLDTTNKKDITIKDMLLHKAGLKAWIPFYINTLETIYPNQKISSNRLSNRYPIKIGRAYYLNRHLKYKDGYYSKHFSKEYPYQVAEDMYMYYSLKDTIYHTIANSDLYSKKEYKYSDLGFYLIYQMLDSLLPVPFEDYVDSVFYKPMGAYTTCFRPLEKYPKIQIAPTENDQAFRRQILRGYVHDPGAAMLGGVCGHAGLFSSANDLAKIMQMYMWYGEYGETEFIEKRTIKHYTDCPECKNGNRRGLGFDKPQTDTTQTGPTYKNVSPESFGHTGFTGTMAWADPEYGIVYIFLSNRVFPDATNFKLQHMDVRTEIQKVIYESIME